MILNNQEASPEKKRAIAILGGVLALILGITILIVYQMRNSYDPDAQESYEEFGETIHSYALNICIQDTNLSSISKYRAEEMISAFLLSTNNDLSNASCKSSKQEGDDWLISLETTNKVVLQIRLQKDGYTDTKVTISENGNPIFEKNTKDYGFTYRPISQLNKALPGTADYDGDTYYITGNAETMEIYVAAPDKSEKQKQKAIEAAKRYLSDQRFDANKFSYRVSDQASDWNDYQ